MQQWPTFIDSEHARIQEFSSEGGPGQTDKKALTKLGSNFFQGGGSNCLFPIETHITCDFPGGGGSGSPVPPSGSALAEVKLKNCFQYVLNHGVQVTVRYSE